MKKKLFLITLFIGTFFVGCQKQTTTTVPTPTVTVEATITPTEVPAVTITEIPEPTVTVAPTEAPTPEPTSTPVPTATSTPIPTSTPTPEPTVAPTNTPIPTPTNTPTPVPECKHGSVVTNMESETDEYEYYKSVCEDCGKVVDTFKIAKATPTPTPSPKPTATPTPRPTATPTPKPVVVDTYHNAWGDWDVYADGTRERVDRYGNVWTWYTNNTLIEKVAEPRHISNAPDEIVLSETGYYTVVETEYDEEFDIMYTDHVQLYNEYLVEYPPTPDEDGASTIYFYTLATYDVETKTFTSRLVNSDGSFNKYSDHIFEGVAYGAGCRRGKKNMEWYVQYVHVDAGYADEDKLIIYPEDLIYYNEDENVIKLFDY